MVNMFSVIINSTVIYWATALDLLILLAILYVRFDKKSHLSITLGQIIGSFALVLVSLFFAVILKLVPEEWILGLLGLIPLGLGIKYLFFGDDDVDEGLDELLQKRKNKSLLGTVIIISFASCGADNVALFTPFFMTLSANNLLLSIIIFALNILILGLLGKTIAKIPHLHDVLEKNSRWILAFVYIILGIMVLLESGTVSKILSFL
ncbi:CadD family cadmium resistance transporter [Lactococcus lactis]|uniref:CadD family cadmium resistance transporter n=1 Tax=Lactococcus lactis TaxID=1358 RepID=UPI003D0CD8A9